MTKLYVSAAFVLMFLTFAAYAQQQSGTRVCSTTTSGSISHEYCTFTPLVVSVQAPAVTVTPAPPTPVQFVAPKPAPPPAAPEKKVKE